MASSDDDIDVNLDDPVVYADPDEFESFDEVDSTTVELPDDSFDEKSADFDSEENGCA